MPVIGVRKTTFNALSAGRKQAFKYVLDRLHIGDPVEYTAPGGAVWYVSCDTRIDLQDAAYLGALAANITDIPSGWTPPEDKTELRRQARQFMETRVVWPVDIPEGADRWQTVLAAQGAPASLQFADGVPDGWTPVEVI